MTFAAGSATHLTLTQVGEAKDPSVPSIRQICMTGILAGKSTAEIALEIQAAHPTSAAAAKSKKHIAWYRSTMKKSGLLPKPE